MERILRTAGTHLIGIVRGTMDLVLTDHREPREDHGGRSGRAQHSRNLQIELDMIRSSCIL